MWAEFIAYFEHRIKYWWPDSGQWTSSYIILCCVCPHSTEAPNLTISNGWCSRHRQYWSELKWTDTGMELNYCAVTAIYLLLFHILCRRSHITHNFVRSIPVPFLTPSPFPSTHDRIGTGCIPLSIDCIEKCAIAALTLDGVYRLCVVHKSTCDVWWPMVQSISLLSLISIRCIHEIRIRVEEMQSNFALPNCRPSIQRCEAIWLLVKWKNWFCCFCKHIAFLEYIQKHFSELRRMEECSVIDFLCNN